MTYDFAPHVVIDHDAHTLTVGGTEFPWCLTKEGPQVRFENDTALVTVTFMAETAEVRPRSTPTDRDVLADLVEQATNEYGDLGDIAEFLLARGVRPPVPVATEPAATEDHVQGDAPEPSFNERNTLATGQSACRSCSAPVAWFVTPTGKRQPVDPVPTESGNVVVDGTTATVLSADALAELDVWTPRYTSHFATCPDADSWRSKAGAR